MPVQLQRGTQYKVLEDRRDPDRITHRQIYDAIYSARGEMGNRIKEQQLGLFADRTSCQGWWANQFRLLLSSAYPLQDILCSLLARLSSA